MSTMQERELTKAATQTITTQSEVRIKEAITASEERILKAIASRSPTSAEPSQAQFEDINKRLDEASMDSALVARLLGRAQWYEEARPGSVKSPELLREAAAEIERLREAVDAYRSAVTDCLREGGVVINKDNTTNAWWDAIIAAQKKAGAIYPPKARATSETPA